LSSIYYLGFLIDTIVFEGSEVYTVLGEIGKGAYARVVKATEESSKRVCALKVEKPPCVWEYYICSQLKLRLPPIKV
jgi:hypothetical protein